MRCARNIQRTIKEDKSYQSQTLYNDDGRFSFIRVYCCALDILNCSRNPNLFSWSGAISLCNLRQNLLCKFTFSCNIWIRIFLAGIDFFPNEKIRTEEK